VTYIGSSAASPETSSHSNSRHIEEEDFNVKEEDFKHKRRFVAWELTSVARVKPY